MFRKLSGLLILSLAIPAKAQAANFALITAPPTMLSVIILLAAGVGLVVCAQVWSAVKGGQMSRVWLLFLIALSLLLVNRAIALVQDFQIATMPDFLAPAILALMAGVFVYGMFEAKRIFG